MREQAQAYPVPQHAVMDEGRNRASVRKRCSQGFVCWDRPKVKSGDYNREERTRSLRIRYYQLISGSPAAG